MPLEYFIIDRATTTKYVIAQKEEKESWTRDFIVEECGGNFKCSCPWWVNTLWSANIPDCRHISLVKTDICLKK